jgi:hypothetical protein
MKKVKRPRGMGRLPAALFLAAAAAGALFQLGPLEAAGTVAHAQVNVFEDAGKEGAEDHVADQDVILHTVQWQGESLTLIAAWYTGDPRNWTILAAINGGDGSDAVRASEVILIPKALLTTETHMPRAFVDFYTQRDTGLLPPKAPPQARRNPKPSPRKEARPRPAPQPAPPAGPLELFGPKD